MTELLRELGPGHPLQGKRVWAVGRRIDCDDVAFLLDDGSWAVVHLTGRSEPEPLPWPNAEVFRTVEEMRARVSADGEALMSRA